jgi:hypothetical protein
LSALVAAFDAIPEARINNYNLQVVMRNKKSAMVGIIANSYHARHVQFFGEDMNAGDLRELCDTSSAISMGNPNLDSRAFSTAVECGIAIAVLANSKFPVVGRGYVGGLMADGHDPASIHVAMAHALRLDELNFPNPDAWRELAARIIGPHKPTGQLQLSLPPSYGSKAKKFPELAHFLRPVT